jgi:glucan 1,3-beta-glucosidase
MSQQVSLDRQELKPLQSFFLVLWLFSGNITMSYSTEPSNKVTYDPLPLSSNDHPADIRYNDPSPEPPSLSYNTPQLGSQELLSDDHIPPAASQARFFGPALYTEVGNQSVRDSLVSSHPASSVYGGSVYALNDRPFDAQSYNDGPYRDDAYFPNDLGSMPLSPAGRNRFLEEKNTVYARPSPLSKRRVLLWLSAAGILLIIVAVGLPIYFTVIRPKHSLSSSHTGSSTSAANPASTGQPSTAITGGDGSKITMEDGTTFIYHNPFGGYWYSDPNDPFNNGARAQSWTPALNETFNYGMDRIRGYVRSNYECCSFFCKA